MSPPSPKSSRPATPFFSARGFIEWAAILLGLFLVAHLAGWREHTTVISGSATTAAGWSRVEGMLGLVYAMLYALAILGVPILVLAAGILLLIERGLARACQRTRNPQAETR